MKPDGDHIEWYIGGKNNYTCKSFNAKFGGVKTDSYEKHKRIATRSTCTVLQL